MAGKAPKAFPFDAGEEELFTHSVKDLLGLAACAMVRELSRSIVEAMARRLEEPPP